MKQRTTRSNDRSERRKSKTEDAPRRRRQDKEEAPEGEEEEETTSRGGGGKAKRGSLAKMFDNAKPQGHVDDGKYVALIVAGKIGEPNNKGQSARMVYEIASEGDFQGQSITQFYQLVDADGQPGKGLGYLKRDLAILEKGDVTFDELEDALEEIADDLTGVQLTVKNNGQFTNAYLNGLADDDDEVEDWRKNRPEQPY